MHRKALPSPHGVPDRDLHGGIESDEELEQGLVGGVDLFLGEAPDPQHVPHLAPGVSYGSVHRHPERHGRRERRKEETAVRAIGLCEEVEGKAVVRRDDLDLRLTQGARQAGDLVYAVGRTGDGSSATRCGQQEKCSRNGEKPAAAHGVAGTVRRPGTFTRGRDPHRPLQGSESPVAVER